MMELLASIPYTQSDMNISNNNLSSTELPIEVRTQGISCNASYSTCALARDLWIYTSPLLLLVGTIGNILIILVMSRKPLRRTAFGLYLIAIAIMDTIALWVGLSRHFIKNLEDLDIRYSHESICSLQRFLLYGSSNASVWLLTAVALERTLSIYSPTRSMKIYTLTKTKVIIAIIIVVQFLWNGHLFFTRGVEEYEQDGKIIINKCGYSGPKARWYYEHNIQTIIATLDYSVIPFIAMFCMNIAIFVRLHKRDKMYNNCTTVRNGTGLQYKTKSSHVSHKTLMLLPVTIFFLISTLPHLIFTGIEEATKTIGEDRAAMELADYFVSVLTYLNHSLNFFLYCLTGRMFRARCWLILTRCCHSKDLDSLDIYSRSPMTKHRSISLSALHSATPSPQGTPNLMQRSRGKPITLSVHSNTLHPPE